MGPGLGRSHADFLRSGQSVSECPIRNSNDLHNNNNNKNNKNNYSNNNNNNSNNNNTFYIT